MNGLKNTERTTKMNVGFQITLTDESSGDSIMFEFSNPEEASNFTSDIVKYLDKYHKMKIKVLEG